MAENTERPIPDMSFARVLVVDDFPSNLVVASVMMKKFKIQVDGAGSGKEALEKIKSGEPEYNAILMDHLMPDMDGVETTRQIRALGSEYAKNLPVIAMTGNEDAGNEKMFLENGFQAFLSKPLTIATLEPVLREWIKA